MNYLFGLLIPIASFIFQLYPRLFNKYFGVDVWTRFIETDYVRKAGHKIPKKITRGFIIEGEFDYPPLFPLLLSFISKKNLRKNQAFIAPFFDALHCFVVFLIAYQLTDRPLVALIAQLIYMLTPIVALENSNLTPRSFGYLNLTLALYPILIYSVAPKLIYLATAYVFIVLIFLTHRFANQSFFFVIILFSILDRTPFYLITFILAGLTAILITKGYYLKVLRGHLYNIYFWILNYHYRFTHQVRKIEENIKHKDFVGKIYYILGTFTPITLIATNVWLSSAFIFFYLKWQNSTLLDINNPMYIKMSIWMLFFYFFAIAVLSIKKLIPIGEGQRYLEMATAPAAVMSSILLFSFFSSSNRALALKIFIGLLLFNLFMIVFVQIKGIIGDKTRSLTSNIENTYKFINKLKGTPRIICLPHQITTMTIYHTKANVLVNADNQGLMKVMDFYPVLKKSISYIAKKFRLDYLLLRESFTKLDELKIKNPKIVFRSGEVILVKL